MEEIARVLTRHPPSDRLPAVRPAQVTAQPDLLSVRAETLASRPIVTCPPGDTVAQAAWRMRDRLVSLLAVDSRPPGLVTATDRRDRVLAAGLDPDTPVRRVMTTPLRTIPADSTLGEVVLAMVDRGIHHLPLTRQGRLSGSSPTPTCCGGSPTIPCSSAASSTGRPAPRSWPPPPAR